MRECRCRWRRDHGPWWMRFSVLWREGSLQRSSRPCLPVSLSRRSSLSPLVSLFPSLSLSLLVCLLFQGPSPSFYLRLSSSAVTLLVVLHFPLYHANEHDCLSRRHLLHFKSKGSSDRSQTGLLRND